MKRLALCLLVFGAVLTNSAVAQRKLNERRAVVPNGFVRIFLLSGSVTVIGWDRDSLLVTGSVSEPVGDRFGIAVSPKGAKLGLFSDVETGVGPSHITVRVPHRSQVWVKTTSADIRVSAVLGGLDLFSVSGSIDVQDAPREVYAETMGGEISLHATSSVARLKTAGGALRVSGSIADLTAVTVSGPINVANPDFQRARIESVDGDIRYAGTIPRGSGLDITNHAGAIDLILPADVSADFAVSLYAGELIDEFGARKKLMRGDKAKAREVIFALGEKPTARVALRSFKGRVALRKPD
jgi:hypothetical protein